MRGLKKIRPLSGRISFIFLAFLTISASAQSDTIVYSSSLLPDISFYRPVYANPSARFYMPAPNTGKMEAGYQYADYNNYHLLSEGDNRSAFHLIADGFSIKGKNAFWGTASYQNQRTRNIQWTEVNDVSDLAIGIVADSIGGSSYGENYSLNGGFARLSGQWTWGLEAGFTGGNDYRKHDPRPKTIISDLFARASIASRIGNYLAGASFRAGLYQQKLGTTIIKENRKDDFFVFRGFAQIDYAESENASSFSWTYEGDNYGGSLFLLPQNNNGWLLNAGYTYKNIDSYAGQNKYPFSFATRQTDFLGGYQRKNSQSSTQIKLDGYYETGKGTERIYEYTKINETYYEYRLLSESRKYTRNRMNWKLVGLQEWFSGKSSRWIGADAGYNHYKEEFNSPADHHHFLTEYNHLLISGRAGTEIFVRQKTSSLWMEAEISYSPLLNSKEITPEKDPVFDQAMKPDLAIRSTSPWGAAIKISYQFPVYLQTKMYISLQACGLTDKDLNRYSGGLSIGFRY